MCSESFAEGSECIIYHGYDLTSKKAIALKSELDQTVITKYGST